MEDQAASLRRLTPAAQVGRSFAFLGVPGCGVTTTMGSAGVSLPHDRSGPARARSAASENGRRQRPREGCIPGILVSGSAGCNVSPRGAQARAAAPRAQNASISPAIAFTVSRPSSG